jgi:very-short-patch-repair endonuclease
MKGKRVTREEVEKFLESLGGRLVSSFRRVKDPILYICSCGAETSEILNSIYSRLATKDRLCGHVRLLMHTHAEVSQFFQSHGFQLLSPEYTGCEQRLSYRCKCGAISEIRFRIFKHKALKGIDFGCSNCSLDRNLALSRSRNGGILYVQTDEFKAKRKATCQEKYGVDDYFQSAEMKVKTEATSLARYGVKSPNQNPDVKKRQQEGFRTKYGVDHFMQNPASKAKFRATLMEHFGVPSLAFVSGRSSLEGQRLFTELLSRLPQELHEKTYFSPRTHEFNVWYEKHYYKYDFVQSALRRCIEYNGTRFHPRPEQDDDETGWCLYHPQRTVQEARAYELQKLEALRVRGFEILVVWDTEVKHDREIVLSRCVEFLLRT